MIVGDELRAWVDDRNRQRETQAAIDAFGRRWNQGPVHQHFTAAMASLPNFSAESVADRIADVFSEIWWVDTLLDGLTEALRSDPCFDPPFRAVNSDIHSGLLVFEDENAIVAAGVSRADQLAAKKNKRRGPSSINFSGYVSVLKFVKAGGASFSFWEAPKITADFTAANAGRCHHTGTRQIRDGEVLVVDGRFQSYVIDHARSNLVVLQASIKRDQAPLSVEYDSRTREYVGCSATDDSACRIQMVTTLLRKLECAAAFPAIAAYLDHPDFFVRWHVMRELLGIDAAAAMPHLENMAASDPHPDVRAAAQGLLGRVAGALHRKAA